MSENSRFVDYLIRRGVLSAPLLVEAFLHCDRILFVPEELRHEAYGDYPLPIGAGQTISQPSTVAIMLELLRPAPGNRVLDIGSGSGWTTALLASAVGEEGYVEGIERVGPLVDYGRTRLKEARITNASIDPTDPAVLGKPGHRYDRILVSASAPRMPRALLDQLKPGGILVIPVRESVWRITKRPDGSVESFELPGFRFVPLIVPKENDVL
jgi:protein-L-isoaspartate(D-aspartate) O-methyltransferase